MTNFLRTYSKAIFLSCCLLIAFSATAQYSRQHIYSNVGWYNYNGTIKWGSKWSAHTELVWRRDEYISDQMQEMLRAGINYELKPHILLRAGYAFAETYNYGDIPINSLGRDFSEHRAFEMVQLSQKEGKLDIVHRFMLEQRFVGRYSSAAVSNEDDFPMVNRIRYMLRLQLPLKGKSIADNTPYIAVYDEVMIAFGNNVNANVFDQNRLGVLLGYRFNKGFRMEAGYINQIAQFGRLVNQRHIFQHNNGVILNAVFNFDLSKKSQHN